MYSREQILYFLTKNKQLNVKAGICREKYVKPIFRERILNQAIYVE